MTAPEPEYGDPVLRVSGLRVSAGRADASPTPLVRDATFDLGRGELVCLVGESGSGKSVSALAMLDLLGHKDISRDGSVRFHGEELIGRSAEPRVMHAVFDHLSEAPEVDVVVDLQSMLTGTDSVLLCARVDFLDTLTAGDLERACVRLDDELHDRFPDLDQIFIEPVPRNDPDLRAAVLDRYGTLLSSWRHEGERQAPPAT